GLRVPSRIRSRVPALRFLERDVTAALLDLLAHLIARDSVEEHGERARSRVEAFGGMDQRHEHFLHDVLRHRGRPAHAEGEAKQPALSPVIQSRERGLIALPAALQQVLVARIFRFLHVFWRQPARYLYFRRALRKVPDRIAFGAFDHSGWAPQARDPRACATGTLTFGGAPSEAGDLRRESPRSRGRSADPDGRGETVGGTGGEGPRVLEGVGGLDADHGDPLVLAEVGHGPGLVDPRVPDDGARGARLGDGDAPVPARVLHGDRGVRAQVDPVGLGADRDRTRLAGPARRPGRLVDE